jgi:tetratricopeptide (TPR) repeat protein
MALFPDRASPESLRATADVWGFLFDRSVERLTDLALLDTQQADLNSSPRYVLHPLVRAFAHAKLAAQPELETAARTRWATDLEQRVVQAIARESYADLPLLEESDLTARAFLDWAERTARWDLFLEVHKRITSLWSVRGRFDVREHYTVRAIAAARATGKYALVSRALASIARLKSYLGDGDAAERLLREALEVQAGPGSGQISPSVAHTLIITQATLAVYANHPEAALDLLAQHPVHGDDAWAQNRQDYWIGRCLAQLGRWAEAQPVLAHVLAQAERIGSPRTAGNTTNLLMAACVAQGDIAGALAYQQRSQAIVNRVQDQRQAAELHRVTGSLHALEGDMLAAREAFAEAIDRFERLGMRRELEEARHALADLA